MDLNTSHQITNAHWSTPIQTNVSSLNTRRFSLESPMGLLMKNCFKVPAGLQTCFITLPLRHASLKSPANPGARHFFPSQTDHDLWDTYRASLSGSSLCGKVSLRSSTKFLPLLSTSSQLVLSSKVEKILACSAEFRSQMKKSVQEPWTLIFRRWAQMVAPLVVLLL